MQRWAKLRKSHADDVLLDGFQQSDAEKALKDYFKRTTLAQQPSQAVAPLLHSLVGRRGGDPCQIDKQKMGPYMYSLLYRVHQAPGQTSMKFYSSSYGRGVSEHFPWQQRHPMPPSAALYCPPGIYSIVSPYGLGHCKSTGGGTFITEVYFVKYFEVKNGVFSDF